MCLHPRDRKGKAGLRGALGALHTRGPEAAPTLTLGQLVFSQWLPGAVPTWPLLLPRADLLRPNACASHLEAPLLQNSFHLRIPSFISFVRLSPHQP